MAKSAQQKFNEYMDECRETNDSVNQLVDRSFDANGSYAYAAGFLGSILKEVIAELPKQRRADYRNRLYRQAQEFKNKMVDKVTV